MTRLPGFGATHGWTRYAVALAAAAAALAMGPFRESRAGGSA